MPHSRRDPATHRCPMVFVADAEFAEQLSAVAWNVAGGYIGGWVNGERVLLHRYVWLLKYGSVPKFLDHINSMRWDCRIENLRPTSRALNGMRNTKKPPKKSGLPTGVEYHGKQGRRPYAATIQFAGERVRLGSFATPEEAGDAYRRAKSMVISMVEKHCQEYASGGPGDYAEDLAKLRESFAQEAEDHRRDRWHEMRSLSEAGEPYSEIAKRLGVSPRGVKYALIEMGVTPVQGRRGRKPLPPSGNRELDERRQYSRDWYAQNKERLR